MDQKPGSASSSGSVAQASSSKAPTARANLQARKQELVRDALWTAAIDLFAYKGFDQTTIDDIVNAAGVSRRTFFRHFESKRDLMAQPVVSFGASLAKVIESSPAGSPPSELFRHVLLEVARHSLSDSRQRKLMEIAAKHPAAREAQLSRGAEVQDRLAQAFARRSKDDVTAHALAGLTLSALGTAHRVWFTEPDQNIGSAVERVLQKFSEIVCGERL